MVPGDPLANLDKDVASAVLRAVEKARWTHVAADYRLGDKRVHAYPLRRSAGKICYGVICNGVCIAQGVL